MWCSVWHPEVGSFEQVLGPDAYLAHTALPNRNRLLPQLHLAHDELEPRGFPRKQLGELVRGCVAVAECQAVEGLLVLLDAAEDAAPRRRFRQPGDRSR